MPTFKHAESLKSTMHAVENVYLEGTRVTNDTQRRLSLSKPLQERGIVCVAQRDGEAAFTYEHVRSRTISGGAQFHLQDSPTGLKSRECAGN